MSFPSEPGRDDGNPQPANIVIPDDARELDRDVLAYRREVRAQRRRQRIARFFRPFRIPEFGVPAAIVPLIAACLAISLVGGALLSVATMSPASAPTLSGPQTPAAPGAPAPLPAGTVRVGGHPVPVRSLVTSAIAIVPADCACGTELRRLTGQAVAAHVGIYFAGSGRAITQLVGLTASYGGGTAVAVDDDDGVFSSTYHPDGLTVLLVFKDATAEVRRHLTASFQLTPALRELRLAGTSIG